MIDDIEYLAPVELILVFIKSLGLAGHLGDVANSVVWLLESIDIDVGSWNSLDELTDILDRKGVKYWHEYEGEVHISDKLPIHANCPTCKVFHENDHGGIA